MADKILTESEVATLLGQTSTSNKCCTYAKYIDFGGEAYEIDSTNRLITTVIVPSSSYTITGVPFEAGNNSGETSGSKTIGPVTFEYNAYNDSASFTIGSGWDFAGSLSVASGKTVTSMHIPMYIKAENFSNSATFTVELGNYTSEYTITMRYVTNLESGIDWASAEDNDYTILYLNVVRQSNGKYKACDGGGTVLEDVGEIDFPTYLMVYSDSEDSDDDGTIHFGEATIVYE